MKTGKICVTITYKYGYINISSSQNEYVICGRSDESFYKKIKSDLIKIIDPTDNWLPMFKKFLNY